MSTTFATAVRTLSKKRLRQANMRTYHIGDLLSARNEILDRQPLRRLEERLDHTRYHPHMRDADINDMFAERREQLKARGGDKPRAEAPGLADLGNMHVESGRWVIGSGFASWHDVEKKGDEDLQARERRLSVSGFVTGRGRAQNDTMAQYSPRWSRRHPLGLPVVPVW